YGQPQQYPANQACQQKQYPQQCPPSYSQNFGSNYSLHSSNSGSNAAPAGPIRLRLINPSRPQSGFSQAMPERLHALARRPIDRAKWSDFMKELNDTLAKAPGSFTNGLSKYWITQVATLGVSGLASNLYADRVLNQAMEVVEKYNRAEFAEYGIVAHLRPAKGGEGEGDDGSRACGGAQSRHEIRRERIQEKKREKEQRRSQGIATLELVIERA
ncbi:hypothetical protein H4R23_006408, partial [Coemansia sp. Cherry 401B]